MTEDNTRIKENLKEMGRVSTGKTSWWILQYLQQKIVFTWVIYPGLGKEYGLDKHSCHSERVLSIFKIKLNIPNIPKIPEILWLMLYCKYCIHKGRDNHWKQSHSNFLIVGQNLATMSSKFFMIKKTILNFSLTKSAGAFTAQVKDGVGISSSSLP